MDLRSDTAQIIEVLHNSTLQKREHWRPQDANNIIIVILSDPGCDPAKFLTLFFVKFDPKCPNLGKYEFYWKKGLLQFSPILVPYLHAKNQKICRLSSGWTAVTYIHTYIRTYIHTYIRTYIHTDIHRASYRTVPSGRSKSQKIRSKKSKPQRKA